MLSGKAVDGEALFQIATELRRFADHFPSRSP